MPINSGLCVALVCLIINPSLSSQISLQLFDARAELHKATCSYALDLNALHTNRTPDFLNRVVCVHICMHAHI